jgi:ABC-2 type transport system permease protein
VTGLRASLSVARGIAWRTVHNALTNRAFLVPQIAFPLFFFLAFAGGLSSLSKTPDFDYPGGYTAFQYCFVLLQSAAIGGVFTGFSIARDFEYGFSRRLLLAAPHRSAIALGYALGAFGRAVVTWSALTIVALLAGMDVSGSGIDLFGLALIALCANAAGSLWAMGIAFRFRTIQAAPLMQVPVFLLLFLSPVFVPYALLRGWIETAAGLNPTTYALEAARSLIAGAPEEVGLAFAVLLPLVAVTAAWALLGMRRAERAG